ASRNPVDFSALDLALDRREKTTITWDTGDATVRGRVYLSIGGAPEVLVSGSPGTSAAKGTFVYAEIQHGQTYDFMLRRVGDDDLLKSLRVSTTFRLKPPSSAWPADFQSIYALEVVPHADSVDIAFRTRLPAAPWVELTNPGTGAIEALWARPGKRVVHKLTLTGWMRPLAQDTDFKLRIITDATKGPSEKGNAEVHGTVHTGSRRVRVYFDWIHVRNDGDPGLKGAGEFTFAFGAGDVETKTQLGNVAYWGEGGIAAGKDAYVDRMVTVEHAPRYLWVQVNAYERDTEFPPGLEVVGMDPEYSPPGSYGDEWGAGEYASVTQHFDMNDIYAGSAIWMSTGNFAIAYDVHGSITTRYLEGWWKNETFIAKLGPAKPRYAHIKVGSAIRRGQGVTFPGKKAQLRVALSPEGALHVMRDRGPDAEPAKSPRFGAAVTVVASSSLLKLFGTTREGHVLRRLVGPDRRDAGWLDLGGDFTDELTAIETPDREHLIALAAGGAAYHLALSARDEEARGGQSVWRPLGTIVVGSLTCLASEPSGLSLFALDPGGQVVHKRLPSADAWQPAEREWDVLGNTTATTLTAEWVGDRDLILTVWHEEGSARSLIWRSYPDPRGRSEWFATYPTLRLPTLRPHSLEPTTEP
ncbi:MAG TPA: hypothetical protein VI299_18075, partial [Polyangiales bacterium]